MFRSYYHKLKEKEKVPEKVPEKRLIKKFNDVEQEFINQLEDLTEIKEYSATLPEELKDEILAYLDSGKASREFRNIIMDNWGFDIIIQIRNGEEVIPENLMKLTSPQLYDLFIKARFIDEMSIQVAIVESDDLTNKLIDECIKMVDPFILAYLRDVFYVANPKLYDLDILDKLIDSKPLQLCCKNCKKRVIRYRT